MRQPQIKPEFTWRAEHYFLASVIRTPRYAFSVNRPHIIFANEDMLSLWRMVEQAINLRGKSDPLLDPVAYEEIVLTAEFEKARMHNLKEVWTSAKDPSIKGSPERLHHLLECYATARLIDKKVCTRIGQLTDGSLSPEDTINNIQQDIVSIHANTQYEPGSVRSIVQSIWDDRKNKPAASIKTGFAKLDETIGTLVPGCTYLWAARTSHGKSSWVSQVVSHQAMAGHKVGVIGLEDSPSVWASRWISRVSGVQLRRIRDAVLSSPGEDTAPLSEEEEVAISNTSHVTHLDNIELVDAKGARLVDVLRILNDLVVRKGVEIIWIDYLQAIYAGSTDSRSRRDFLEYAWAMMEREAERLQVPLMITAQLNRQWEMEPISVKPGLRNVEWMGAAEQKCYVGAILYRPYRDPRVSTEQQDREFNKLIVNVEKCKQGESKAIEYYFDPAGCQIREM